MAGGYQRLYFDHVLQADTGADLDFLVGCRGHVVTGIALSDFPTRTPYPRLALRQKTGASAKSCDPA
jgi:hypothetical protein